MQSSPNIHQELTRRAEYISLLAGASSVHEIENQWKQFLYHLERVWYKCENHFGKSPKWNGWKGKFEVARKRDPLLSYLINARGADEHTVEEITEKKPGSIGIGPGHTGSVHIKSLEFGPDGIKFDGEGSLKLTFSPASIQLLPVVNRGRTYLVPTQHKGTPIQPGILNIAKAGLDFYAKLVADAEEHFVK
jgi:hypothetical protein